MLQQQQHAHPRSDEGRPGDSANLSHQPTLARHRHQKALRIKGSELTQCKYLGACALRNEWSFIIIIKYLGGGGAAGRGGFEFTVEKKPNDKIMLFLI